MSEYRQRSGTLSLDIEPMLAHTLLVLRRQRPGPSSPRAYHVAYSQRENAVWYYDRLLEAIRADLGERRWWQAARRAATFVRYLPQHRGYAARRLTSPLRAVARLARRRISADGVLPRT